MHDSAPVDEADFDALLELLEAQTMREVVGLFVAAAPDRLRAAHEGLGVGDIARVATAFHTLRSGCGQLGARRLESLCATGEQVAKRGDLAAATSRLAEIRMEYDRVLEWLQARGWLGA